MKDKTKKGLIIAGLAAVCVIAVFGISRVLYKEPVQTLPEETESTEKKTDLVIEVETDNSVESGAQEIQPNPEKTEDEKPQEPPVLAEDADVTNPDTKPAYEEEPEKKPENPTPPVDDTPKTGDTKDGMVYVEGFGWLPDEGAGSGTAADDMYENGNKVGIMD